MYKRQVYGGLRFFERAEIKNSLAYLRLIANKKDDNAFLRIVNFPPRGIGAKSIELIQNQANDNQTSLWDAALTIESENKNAKVSLFVNLIKNIEDQVHGTNIDESINAINSYSTLKEHYTKDKDGSSRIENLDELVSAAKSFLNEFREESSEDGTDNSQGQVLADFLDFTSLESGELQATAGDDALQLMTIHSSKGLEFDTVFITGLEDGLCPHERSLSENNGLEEERRLMYVAITRARKNLYLTLAQSRMTYGQIMYNMPSRFLDEIPDELIKKINAPKKEILFSHPKIAPYSESKHTWRIGASVEHAKFGVGIVTGYEGNDDDLRIQINFQSQGIKWRAMEYANRIELEKLFLKIFFVRSAV